MIHDTSSFSAVVLVLACVLGLSVSMACSADDKVLTEYRLADFSNSSAWRITSLRGSTGASKLEDGVLTCDFTGRPGYIGIGGGVGPVAGDPSEVALTFESNTSGHPIVLRFLDSRGQYFQREAACLDADGVRTVRMPLGDMDKWYHFGGPDDGIVRPPIKLAEIIVDHDGTNTSVRLIELKAKTEIAVDQGIVFQLASRKQESRHDALLLECRSILPWEVEASYSWRVTDFFGEVLDAGDERITLRPDEVVERGLDVGRKGVKLCEFQLEANVPVDNLQTEPPKPLKTRAQVVAVTEPDTIRVTRMVSTSVVELKSGGSAELLPDSPFGMGIYLGQRWPSSEMEKPADIAQAIGIKWMRDEFNWGHVEPEKGKWNWERFDAAVETATTHGISIFGLLCYWAPWAKPHTEEGIRDYCNYVRTVVGRYKHQVKHWEIWNEPNIFFWTGTVEQYAELLKAAYDAVKEADPEAKVIGCCTAGTDLNFIEKVFQLGGFDKMDILSIHPYRYPGTPEETDFIGELKRADALVRKYGAPKEIWLTEIGWPTHVGSNGAGETKQAAMIVRTYIQAIVSGVVQKTFWYNFRNDGTDVNYNEHNFGIIRRDHSAKPACIAFRTMTDCLEGKRFVRALDCGEGVCAYLFEGGGRRTIAAWCASGTATLVIFRNAKDIEVVNLIGERTSAEPSKDRVSVELSENPVFIEGVPADFTVGAESVKPAKPAKVIEAPVRITVLPLSASRFAVELVPVRSLKRPARVTVRIPGYVDVFDLSSGKQKHVERYDLPEGVSLGVEKGLPVLVAVDTQPSETKRSNVYYVPCPHAAGTIVIDGRLDECDLGPPIDLGKSEHVQELDPGKWSGPDDLSAHIWTAWDDSNFYLIAKVTDDVFCQDKQEAEMWQGDSIQFALDPLHLESEGPGASYEIGLALTPNGPRVYCWFAPDGREAGLIPGATLVVKREGNLTIYEASIPLSALAPLQPAPGKTIGFSVLVNDDDGEGRKSWLEWSSGIGRGKKPSLYGDLTFAE